MHRSVVADHVRNWLPKHYNFCRSHYVTFYIKSGRVFLKERKDGAPVKSVVMVWKHYIQTTQPMAWDYMEYQAAHTKWLKFDRSPETKPAYVPEIEPRPSLSYFSFLIKRVIYSLN